MLKKHIVAVLKKMNKDSEFSGANGDKAFITTMMVKIFGDGLGSEDELCPRKIRFIKGKQNYYL